MTVLIFFIVLSVLVLVHEWGHFVTAKKAGAKVEEFGFGFPPKVFSVTKNGTIFSFNLIPFGGFVKIYGETGEHRAEAGSFSGLKISKRVKIVVAGVVMNAVLAFLLLSLGNLVGRPTIIDEKNESSATNIQIQIIEVSPDSPAEIAGIKPGDAILKASVDEREESFSNVSDFKKFVDSAAGSGISLQIKRGAEVIDFNLTPRLSPPAEEGALGVLLVKTGLVKSPGHLFLWQGFKDTLWMIFAVAAGLFLFFKTLIFEGRVMGDIAGPVGIATLAGQAYSLGFSYLINLVAVLSVNLAILNILPFPALDGGRLVFLLAEKIKGSPLSQKLEQAVNVAGFALLLALMIFVTWKDIVKFF